MKENPAITSKRLQYPITDSVINCLLTEAINKPGTKEN